MGDYRYAICCLQDVKEGKPRYKLDRTHVERNITSFNISSNWFGEDLTAGNVGSVVVIVKSEELESVKNFLLTLRG
jgi:hypothetical protein